MNRTTRQALPVAVAVAMAALVVGTGIASAQAEPAASVQAEPAAAASAATGSGAAAPVEPLLAACEDSKLPPHTGFEIGPACVATPFGEVGAAEDNPQLLITEAPDEVTVGRPFTIKVSTRNLVRDRFLPAAQGGYYVEPSTLNEDGLVRGHFHTACRVLGNIDQAPEPERQAVFVATEDGGGGTAPDTVTVKIPGLPAAGEIQCAAWAGDGSHRMPMMQFANQIPAFDAVRITVKGKGKGKGSTPANAGRPADTGGRADATPRVDDNQGSTTGKGTDAGGRSTPGKATDAGGRSTTGKATDAGKGTDAGGRSTSGQ
jgi:hypothetical protein